jgi:hypothetical protein
MFAQVTVPAAVYEEVVAEGKGRPGAVAIAQKALDRAAR